MTGYRFHIRGHLDDRWSEWLGDLTIERMEDGTSILSGPVPDQAALHGVIARIRDLGVPLLAVDYAGDACTEVSPSVQPEARGSPHPSDTTQSSFYPRPLDDHTDQPTTNFEGVQPCD
jgi:hypothetical protein